MEQKDNTTGQSILFPHCLGLVCSDRVRTRYPEASGVCFTPFGWDCIHSGDIHLQEVESPANSVLNHRNILCLFNKKAKGSR